MSHFSDRPRYTEEEARGYLMLGSRVIMHLLINKDGSYSIMTHNVAAWCDYCDSQGDCRSDYNALPLRAKEDPYELQNMATAKWDKERGLLLAAINALPEIKKDEFYFQLKDAIEAYEEASVVLEQQDRITLGGEEHVWLFLPEIIDALKTQLISDELRWGDTWCRRDVGNQVERIYERFQTYHDQHANGGVDIPWLKIIGLAAIAWIRENHPEVLIDD